MTPKQKLFVSYYLGEAHFNASEAAKLAGFNPKTAGQTGFELLKKLEIREKIDERLSIVAMTADETLAAIAAIARSGKSDTVRLRALEMLARIHRLFDSQTVTVNVAGPDPADVRAILAARIERIAAAGANFDEADIDGMNGHN